MILVHTIKELQTEIAKQQVNLNSVGFVPTMGALHTGHVTLVKQSCEENDINVVSIFVNPTQFNDKRDLEKYPRTLDNDLKLLSEETSADIVFAPSAEDMYPEVDTRTFDFGQLDKVMEGKFRPGHFNGVAQIVSKLFDIVKPDAAYFGEKDFQQLAIIRNLVNQLNLNIKIVGVPIVRETSGLAMSSRNNLLSAKEKENAAIIYKTLKNSLLKAEQDSVSDVLNYVVSTINKHNGFEVEYYEIVDGDTLQPVKNWADSQYVVGCITVFCDKVRLIDNITYYNKK